jgi:SAM-dependent methyltransferase
MMTISLLILIFVLVYVPVALFVGYMVYVQLSGAPFVPTSRAHVEKMMTLSSIRAGERVIDLGSGEGRIVFAAARRGAQSVGVELHPFLYLWSVWRAKVRGISNASFMRENLWIVDLSGYDVVFLFLIPHRMKKLKKKLFTDLKPGTRVISNGFSFPDWQYVRKDGTVYLYIV